MKNKKEAKYDAFRAKTEHRERAEDERIAALVAREARKKLPLDKRASE